MSKRKKFYVNVPKLVTYNALDQMMFAYVIGRQGAMPSTTLHMAIEMFMEDFNLHEDNYPMDHAKGNWYRMLELYKVYRKLDK